MASPRRQSVGEVWSQDLHQGNQSELAFSYRVVCIENYHGNDCSVFCRPRDDDFGHFRCDPEGRRRCLEGWSGQYCTEGESRSRRATSEGTFLCRDATIPPRSDRYQPILLPEYLG